MKSWVLMTTLPSEIRALPDLLDGADERDTTYQGFVTMIVSLIYLNAGVLQEGTFSLVPRLSLESLSRYLRYLSIEETTPLMSTDALLTRMAKQGYIEKIRDMVTGEPRFDYHLGPRGKIEVGKKGTMEFISRVCFARLRTNGRYTGMI
jgi:melanoma-associated antigen